MAAKHELGQRIAGPQRNPRQDPGAGGALPAVRDRNPQQGREAAQLHCQQEQGDEGARGRHEAVARDAAHQKRRDAREVPAGAAPHGGPRGGQPHLRRA
eukprot:66015-Rhodomonas_salina.2